MSPADPEDRDDSAGYPADSAADSAAESAAESIAGSAAESAAFDDIVAGWRAEGEVPDWPIDTLSGGHQRSSPITPQADRPVPPRSDRPAPMPGDRSVPAPGDRPLPPSGAVPAPGQHLLPPRSYTPLPADDDHFVPPEPPPLPRIGRAAAVGMGLIALGLTLLLAPGLLGISESVGLTLGLLTVAGGLGWLVLGSWASDPPDDDYGDDGAVF